MRVKLSITFTVAIITIACGTTIWTLNAIGLIPGPWAAILAPIFAGVAITVPLLDYLLAITSRRHER